jgi:alginate O-acetyltransferase complex protein AlgI
MGVGKNEAAVIYSNPEFLILFIPTLILFLALKNYSARFYVLLGASLLFYAWAGLEDTLVFFLVISSSWAAVYAANRFSNYKKAWITVGVLLMTLHLFFWKYSPWVVSQIQAVYPKFWGGRPLELPLPIGISFFTLQGIAYLVDFAKGKANLMKFKEYFLFKSFFPQLVAGPIVRSYQLLPQLKSLKRSTYDDLAAGVALFCLGFFKKIAIADRTAPFVDVVFKTPAAYDRPTLVMGALAYSVQIWADFSGYTDMGRGVARMLGIQLPENFHSPYFAQNPAEFWKRWHITLSEWIRDYLYIPMGGSRGNRGRVALVTVTTMAIAGAWHGANWTFIIWGIYHGLLLIGHRGFKNFTAPAKTPFWWTAPLKIVAMQSAVVTGWILFRSTSLADFGAFIRKLGQGGAGESLNFRFPAVGLMLALTLVLQAAFFMELKTKKFPALDWVRFRFTNAGSLVNGFTGAGAGIVLALLFLGTLFVRVSESSSAFIYFQF